METNIKNTATFTHLSALTQYFIPFGNIIFPLVIWSTKRKDSEFVDRHGKQVINFQLSLFLYTLILAIIAIPTLVFTVLKNVPFSQMIDGNLSGHDISIQNLSGIVAVALVAILIYGILKVAEFFLVIFASVKAANGEDYTYPLTIRFIK